MKNFFWPGMNCQITEACQSCDRCQHMCLNIGKGTTSDKNSKLSYCKTGNVNEQVMLTNLTSGMGSLIFLPRQQLYPINNYIPSTIISHQQLYPVNHYYHINSTTTVQFQQSTLSPQRDEVLNKLEFWTILISLI